MKMRSKGTMVFIRYCFFSFISVLFFTNGLSATPAYTRANIIIRTINSIDRLPIFHLKNKPDTVVNNKPDLYYECKLADIGKNSPIDFDYNSYVKRYIDIFTIERMAQVAKMIGLSEYYFPLFEEILSKYQLPLELKYLAVVESALNPLAVSPSGAVGLWQFKINTAKMFDLKVTNFVDERMDPIKSTEAAAQYLQYLFRTFNDWHLALAAYNVGPGAVRNAIERANGERSFWKLYPQLPESAQNYVPAFIAIAYVFQNYQDHGLIPSSLVPSLSSVDTIEVKKPLDLRLTSEELGIDIELIRFLNPTYRYDYVPESDSPQIILLPKDKIGLFIRKSKQLYLNTSKPKGKMPVGSKNGSYQTAYTVRNGDTLHKLAIHFGCTLDDIYRWNPGIDSVINVGQTLIFWVDDSVSN